MSNVFVLDTNKQPLNPVHPGRARLLLKEGKAAVWKRYPFTILLKTAVEAPQVQTLRVKVDPGSKTTGLALVNDATMHVVFAAELSHRGEKMKASLNSRRLVRRSRRQRKTRYRKPRWQNRRRQEGWLPPSLESRISNILTWVSRLRRLCPIAAISQEVVRFDTQRMENAEISGVQYQQGTLAGYETREYLLLKWKHACTYCGATRVPLQIEHIDPRAMGGTNRVSNLCLACEACNQAKGTRDIREFLKTKPDLLKRILAQTKAPLKDVAAVNATRWALYERLKTFGLPIEGGSGGLTKYNRVTRGLTKTHWLDAVCVGRSTPASPIIKDIVPLSITATGHGSRQMCRMDKFGFPRTGPKQHKRVQGFQTGDLVRAVVTSGAKKGIYVGKVAVRTRGSFNITTASGVVTDIHHRFCVLIAHSDGYTYQQRKEAALPPTV